MTFKLKLKLLISVFIASSVLCSLAKKMFQLWILFVSTQRTFLYKDLYFIFYICNQWLSNKVLPSRNHYSFSRVQKFILISPISRNYWNLYLWELRLWTSYLRKSCKFPYKSQRWTNAYLIIESVLDKGIMKFGNGLTWEVILGSLYARLETPITFPSFHFSCEISLFHS